MGRWEGRREEGGEGREEQRDRGKERPRAVIARANQVRSRAEQSRAAVRARTTAPGARQSRAHHAKVKGAQWRSPVALPTRAPPRSPHPRKTPSSTLRPRHLT